MFRKMFVFIYLVDRFEVFQTTLEEASGLSFVNFTSLTANPHLDF